LRRALRIFPLYYAVLIAYLLGHRTTSTGASTTHQAWYWFYLMNYVTSGPPRLDHFWTLAIEEQFLPGLAANRLGREEEMAGALVFESRRMRHARSFHAVWARF
jgi:peptidoglycan/LPS O-acetylase OafA/YrhL